MTTTPCSAARFPLPWARAAALPTPPLPPLPPFPSRRPGEAQCIDRIMEAFAGEVFRQCPGLPFASADTAFVLAFALIMLNTNLHNPNIAEEQRMTLEQFVKQNRDVDGGRPLPQPFVAALYASLRDREIELRGAVGDEMSALETGKLEWGRLLATRTQVQCTARRARNPAPPNPAVFFFFVALL